MKRLLASMLTMGIMMGAAEAADARLQAVLRRLDAGEPVTVAVIGGSITTGYAANPPRERGWAAQVAAWLAQRGNVRFVNAGVSGTDSAIAAQRLQAHVLDAAPDLVVVEFGVNDHWLDSRVRESSYEGVLRQLLSMARPPAVVALALPQRGDEARDAVEPQLRLAAHYGLTAIDFGRWMQHRVDAGQAQWETLYDEPVHPNQRGHDAIAEAVIDTLQAAAEAPRGTAPHALVPPLHGREHEFVHALAGDALVPWRNSGFRRGGAVHPEWAALPGGQAPGWTTTADDAEAAFVVWGTEIALFHAESEHYRDLEAWVDDGTPVVVRGYVPERQGYLGWHYTVLGRGLEAGAHLLHVRVRRDGFAGSGRPSSVVAVMAAGLLPPALQAQQPGDFVPAATLDAGAGWRLVRADDADLRYVGRFDRVRPLAPLLSWSGSEIRARFSGTRLALRLEAGQVASFYTVEVDGRRHVLALRGRGTSDWQLREPLPPGAHELRIVKRTEGAIAEARFLGLLLAGDGQLLAPPPERALRLEFYGDSITAGACNGDIATDQYDDLSTHDGTRAYGALVAERLRADYVGIAVSGIGITRTWGDVLMPQVWDRVSPHAGAAVAPPGTHLPDVVVVNLGQNDQGFPASRGEAFAADFGERYLAFVRGLRQRYPQARLVLAIGGMSAWKEQPALELALAEAARRLRAEGDQWVWTFRFEAFSWAHPRIDVHARMADELERFLRESVLP
ncbi:MAG: GDSL-type esterase/lipase family protein [Betaproteobacteria bacterium]